MRRLILPLLLAATAACVAAPQIGHPPTDEQSLPGGAAWSARVPVNWNGTLLLYSRGYAPSAGHPEPAPEQYEEALLAEGYALAGSNYGSGGWALAEAVPAQEATVAAFAKRYGKPKLVIAYGFSMGGLVTTALVEKPRPSIDGAISLCSSMAGSIGMMNMGLDGAFTFKTLLAPNSAIKLVDIKDDRANGALVQVVAEKARATPAGRARLALAATFAGIPAWVPEVRGESPAERREREVEALVRAFPMGVFLPRAEQEQRAGVGYSWNTGIDYADLLVRTGRDDFMRAVYDAAGLDLDADLEALAQAERIPREPTAVAYMTANYVPSGKPVVPMLAIQNLGDPVTSPSLQESYASIASVAMLKSLYLPQAGHCRLSKSQILDAVGIIGRKLDSGRWEIPAGRFSDLRPHKMPRGQELPGQR